MKEILDKTQKHSIDDRKRIVNKKFSRIVYLAVLLVIPILGYLQWGRDVAVCSSNPNIFSNGSLEEISIIANKLYIFDRETNLQNMYCRDARTILSGRSGFLMI